MLTIFTIPKPFTGHIGVIQRNAIASWVSLDPKCEVILFGNEPGVHEAACDFGIRHVPEIRRNEFGTPYLDDVFSQAQNLSCTETVCYCNADIIFFNDICNAVKNAPAANYLMVGERWDLDLDVLIDTRPVNWQQELLAYARSHHTVQNFPGMDYFIFPRGMLQNIPPFLVGRRGWDNWLIYHVRKEGIPVIDVSRVVPVIHQNHSYAHVPQQEGKRWEGPESWANIHLAGDRQIYLWELSDADWVLTEKGLQRKPSSLRTAGQNLILSTPERYHALIDPFYRIGHAIQFVFLKIFEMVRNIRDRIIHRGPE